MIPSNEVIVEIEGKRFELQPSEYTDLDCVQINEDTWHLLEDGHAHTITILHADPANKKYTLRIDGQIKETSLLGKLDILIEKMGLNAAQSKKQSVLKAPMPGMVTGIKVEVGQEVEKGAPLIILEAMKMENMIVAPHHAVIKTIHVHVSQAIDKGTALIEFS
jgi:biotin carboxyl carrier protein